LTRKRESRAEFTGKKRNKKGWPLDKRKSDIDFNKEALFQFNNKEPRSKKDFHKTKTLVK